MPLCLNCHSDVIEQILQDSQSTEYRPDLYQVYSINNSNNSNNQNSSFNNNGSGQQNQNQSQHLNNNVINGTGSIIGPLLQSLINGNGNLGTFSSSSPSLLQHFLINQNLNTNTNNSSFLNINPNVSVTVIQSSGGLGQHSQQQVYSMNNGVNIINGQHIQSFEQFQGRLNALFQNIFGNNSQNNPATEQQIQNLQKIQTKEVEQCSICQNIQIQMQKQQQQKMQKNGIKLPCQHKFHSQCLKQWFKRANTCPTCRASISSTTSLRHRQMRQQ